ncbi:MAG: DUF4258 domain-containing protein [Candidatus Omnitrophica bacterium]|nr:DUF4258 domain-containing protein [Candidatus Omnitrophota bacterium]
MNFDIHGLRRSLEKGRVQWQRHALERIFQRGIKREDVFKVLNKGKVIEEYLDDNPWPSALLLGWISGQPLHVVVAYSHKLGQVAIITVYEPSLDYFEDDFQTRRRKNV